MRLRQLCLVIFAIVSTVGPPRADAQTRDAPRGLGENAALQYWQAFALLPRTDPEQDKLLENWRETPLDAKALKLADSFSESRKYLLRASGIGPCDWGLEYKDGQFLQLPYLAQTRTLANLAALHARAEFERDRQASGVEDVLAMFHLARHLEAEPIIIVQMFGFRIEAHAIDIAAAYLKPNDASTVDSIAQGLARLRPWPTSSRVIQKEKEVCAEGLAYRLKDAEGRAKGSWREVWKPLEHDTKSPVTTFDEALAASESMVPYFDRLAEQAALPWDQFDPNDGAYLPRLKAANKLAYVFLASMVNYVAAERRARTRLELFRAALSLVKQGPDALKAFKDPADDGQETFRLEELGGGAFQLSSKLLDAPSARLGTRPVAVTVGKGAATFVPKGATAK